jgi:Tfp pilus assembly protein PilV
MIRTKSQTGDTIVEVLLSIAVLSSVLGGAFVSANHSLKSTRAAQERGEALKLVESQVEQLGATPLNCYSPADPANCKYTPPGSGVTYHVTITRVVDTVTVKADWENVFGTGSDNVEIVYRTK